MPPHIIILGAGITGLTTALAIQQFSSAQEKPTITIYELRSGPSTIGGAVNLTPKALRYLDYLGVYSLFLSRKQGAECRKIDLLDLYTGDKYAEVDFEGTTGRGMGHTEEQRFVARRVRRAEIQEALLEKCRAVKGIEVVFGQAVEQITETEDGLKLRFKDGEVVNGTLLLGCDGIHSAARKLLVEPDRKPKYTGVATAMACINLRAGTKLPWQTTALITSRRGSLMASYFDPSRDKQYIAAVMETKEVADKEGWRVRGAAQESMKKDIQERFQSPGMPEIGEMITDAQEWSLYPVYALPPRGNWVSPGKKCILLGDSAHAMPPQGESTGICIEDGIAFAQMFNNHHPDGLEVVFTAYEQLRREHVEAAYKLAASRWENVKDCGWFAYKMRVWMTPWILWWTANAREIEFAEDLVQSLKDKRVNG